MTQQQQQTDGVIPPPENLEFPEATDTSASDATWFAELSDLADITDSDALSNDSSTSSFTPPPTYDLNLEDLPTFNLEDVDLTNLDIDLSLAHLEACESNESNESSEPFYEPAPLHHPNQNLAIEAFTFKHKCGYCGRPAGWQHNTRHFIQLRSGHRYACFACLCQRWRARIPHNSPGLGLGLSLPPLNTKNHNRRLPRRRILEQRLKHEQSKSKSKSKSKSS